MVLFWENECECGCGRQVSDSKYRFILGHNQRGTKRSPETLEKLRKTLSIPEVKQRQSQGTKNAWTEEKKAKHIEKRKGKKHSQAHCDKISKGNKGKVRTDDVKQRISDSLKGKYAGESNPFYKHGNSNKNKMARQTFEYTYWRKQVFERDNYTCVDCGIGGGGYVTAHHIKSFAHYPDLRYDIDNGKTLCEICHSKTDNYKGRKKNQKNRI